MAIYIGIQTEAGANFTGISVGPISEAWLNLGWPGIVLAGAFFGLLFGLPAQMSNMLNPRQAGWLIAANFSIYSADLEFTLVEIICSLCQTLLPGVVLLVAISRARARSAREQVLKQG